MIRSADDFDVVAGVLQGDILAPYLFIFLFSFVCIDMAANACGSSFQTMQ